MIKIIRLKFKIQLSAWKFEEKSWFETIEIYANQLFKSKFQYNVWEK